MIFSFALMFLCGFALSEIMEKLKLPRLIGMLFTGILLGPYVLNLIVPEILTISTDLREIALIVILARAGLALNINDLKKVGRPAILMCFLPATLEIIATTLLAPLFFPISYLEAAIMGTVLGAVSPAVIIPKMLMLMDKGYGKAKSIPQMIMAGASVDDIYVIVLFTSFLSMYSEGSFDVGSFIRLPIAIMVGLFAGALFGYLIVKLFEKVPLRDTIKVIIVLSFSFLLVTLETVLKDYVPLSGLLAVVALGGTILLQSDPLAHSLSNKLSKIWVGAELLLFVLVGATVNLRYVRQAGLPTIALILLVLAVRMFGVYISLLNTDLTTKERLFCGIAFLPKATVQAAIGGIPLAVGVGAGNTILTVAVLAILITAPLGAIGIDTTYRKLLKTA